MDEGHTNQRNIIVARTRYCFHTGVQRHAQEVSKSEYVACSLDARWFASELSLSSQNSSISSNVTEKLRDFHRFKYKLSYAKHGISHKPLGIQLDWASYLNPNITGWSNGTLYRRVMIADFLTLPMVETRDVHNNTFEAFLPPRTSDDAPENYAGDGKVVASLLSFLPVDGATAQNLQPSAFLSCFPPRMSCTRLSARRTTK